MFQAKLLLLKSKSLPAKFATLAGINFLPEVPFSEASLKKLKDMQHSIAKMH